MSICRHVNLKQQIHGLLLVLVGSNVFNDSTIQKIQGICDFDRENPVKHVVWAWEFI